MSGLYCENLCVWCIWLYVIIMSCMHYSRLNDKELYAQNRWHIWSLSDCNEIRTHNQLVCKQTLNQLAKLAK